MPVAGQHRLSLEQRTRLLAEDAALIGKPFAVVGHPRAVQAHTRHMALVMGDSTRTDRVRRAAAFAADMQDMLIDHSVRNLRHQAGAIACAKGCAHCCTTGVTATIPEVLVLAAALHRDERHAARTRDAAQQAARLPADVKRRQRVPCPVLENNVCTAYAARPTACRGLLSTNLAACEDIFERLSTQPMPFAADTSTVRTVVLIMIKAALRLNGLEAAHVNLSEALEVALATPDAEARWLAGEPVFASVARDLAEQNPHFKNLVDGLADGIRPTL